MHRLARLGLGSTFLALSACSSASHDEATPSETEDVSHKKDAGAPVIYPAFAVNPAQVVNRGGPILTSPKLQVITFAGDPDAPSIESLASRLGASSYWAQTTSEYGIGKIAALPPIRLSDAPPAAIDDAQFLPWLSSKIAKLDASTIYAVFYPQGTTVTIGTELTGCVNSLGYHSDGVTSDGTDVAYVVMPRCSSSANLTGLDTLTSPFSHELIEAVTDPLSQTNQAYFGLDDAHFGFQDAYLEEVGDLCVQDRYLTTLPSDIGFTVQRSWSNASARAGHHPCVPAPAVYFNAQPIVSDSIAVVDRSGRSRVVKGVKVTKGRSKTIDVQLFSDAPTPTSGAFSLIAYDMATVRGRSAEVTLTLDVSQGKNGDLAHLTIKRALAPANGKYSTVMLWSTLNGESNFFPFVVGP